MQPRQPGGLINPDIRAITNQSNKFPSFVLTYQTDNQCFMLAASFLQQLALEAHKRHGSSDLNLNSLQGTFDLFGHTVRVCPATLTSWECSDWRDSDTEKSAAIAQRNLCFYTNRYTIEDIITTFLTMHVVKDQGLWHKYSLSRNWLYIYIYMFIVEL